jgi:prepilin signal peptidase PulO-like enzyme (type II secretory pathway)
MTTTYIIANIGVFGLLIGSFFSCLEYRIANKKKGAIFGRSTCPHCNRVISSIYLIPILGFFFQKGKCIHCKEQISQRYLIIELFTAISFMVAAIGTMKVPDMSNDLTRNILLFADVNTHLFYVLFATASLVFLAYYDSQHKLILDRVALPTIAFLTIFSKYNVDISLKEGLIGAAIAVGFFLIQIIISKGKWMGGGDLRIAAIMGVLLGWKLVLLALFLSYAIGAIISLPILFKDKKETSHEVPFAPFLAIGTVITLAWGSDIIDWYINLL